MRRRDFLMGGFAAGGVALVAGCSSGHHNATEQPSPPSQPQSTTSTIPPAEAAVEADAIAKTDLMFTRTAASIEALAVDTYQRAAASGLLVTQSVASTLLLLSQHHTDHLRALNGMLDGDGAAPISAPNEVLRRMLVAPVLAAAHTETDLVMLALTLEETAARHYAYAAPAMSTPAQRSTLMTIGGVEARHVVLVGNGLSRRPIDSLLPGATFPIDDPLPPDAAVH